VRPVLTPAARRLWRGTRTLQLCLTPARGVLLDGLDEGTRHLLALLDGSRTHEQVLSAARAAGCADPEQALATLRDAGLLLDADDLQVPLAERADRLRLAPDAAALALRGSGTPSALLRARHEARVVVHGGGRVGGPLAALLSEAGVGTVDLRDPAETGWEDVAVGGLRPADVGTPRGTALGSRLRSAGSLQQPALVVLTEEVPEQLARVLARDAVPHLAVRAEGLVGVVGPLVLPGQSACLRCLALVQEAIDPDWPHLVPYDEPGLRGAAASHSVLAAAVAAQAALQALELVEGGRPASVGGSLELELPGWAWRRRTWPAHPGCDCGADARRFADSA
jgi:bacteriocin biosynthesis cyclodehydratase domain-containing protein